MSDSAANRRSVRNVLVHRPMQREFALTMIAIMMTAGALVSVLIHLSLQGITEGRSSTISRLALERLLADVNSQLILGTILILFATVLATGLFGIFFLHRVAGPVYRFRQVLRQMGAGEIPRRVTLREGDFFKETAAELNDVIELLKHYDETASQIGDLLDEHKGKEIPKEVSSELHEIHQALDKLKKLIP